jgi:predicted dinucleotide-binding enzyme
MNITIIGTGKMARAIAARLLEQGHHITLVGHSAGKAEALAAELSGQVSNGSISAALPNSLPGEMVILAVPYSAVHAILRQYNELLPGKILVDITNPVDYQTMQSTAQDGSAAEEIDRLTPQGTRVIKALNTVFAATLLAGKVDGTPLDVFIAGEDAEAKAQLSGVLGAAGLRVIDTGPLIMSRQLEALGLLHIAIQSTSHLGFKSAIKILS